MKRVKSCEANQSNNNFFVVIDPKTKQVRKILFMDAKELVKEQRMKKKL